MKLSRRKIVLGLAALAGVAYGGYRLYQRLQPYEWSGTVEARVVSIGSRAGGRVKTIAVSEGQRVDKGQTLLTLELGDWDAQLLEAQGQLTQMQANLDKLKRGARPEELEAARARALTATAALQQTEAGARPEQIAAAEARLAAQTAALDKAKLDATRARRLADSGAGARVDVDNADNALQAATAQRDASARALDELKNGSRREEVVQARARQAEQAASERLLRAGTRAEDIRAAEGAVAAAQGRLDRIQSMKDELTVKAPVSGRIEALDLRPGDIVAPNATAATLLEDGQLYVRIYIPETLLGHVRELQHVAISVDSFPREEFDGVIQHVASVGEFSPRDLQTADERADQVFACRVGIVNGADKLRAGMAAFITVPR